MIRTVGWCSSTRKNAWIGERSLSYRSRERETGVSGSGAPRLLAPRRQGPAVYHSRPGETRETSITVRRLNLTLCPCYRAVRHQPQAFHLGVGSGRRAERSLRYPVAALPEEHGLPAFRDARWGRKMILYGRPVDAVSDARCAAGTGQEARGWGISSGMSRNLGSPTARRKSGTESLASLSP